ncbi:MAG: 16S rRNA (guanine(966)-N(2))-methyltransferase RsmD [Defluviitaleaceae bacterium]|nr:16S rRNA (guanine(966)-N(2))-methyltransferase RsmD [Defluviitaleaceae bacterium]
MRVIAGKARRTALAAPKGQATRPTADRVKENLFNIISHYVPGARFLDLFCGSGAIGVEALSRGAETAVFVDISKDAILATNSNIARTRLEKQSKVLQMCVIQAITKLKFDGNCFDIIFMDPPYNSTLFPQVAKALETASLLSDEGILIAEIGADEPLPDVSPFVLEDNRTYGNTQLLLYKRKI